MAHSKAYARQLVRNLPEEPADLVERRSYYDLMFIELFLDYCDEVTFCEPRLGLTWSKITPRLLSALPPDQTQGKEQRRKAHVLMVRAFTVLGGAYRSVGQFGQAEIEYDKALRLAAENPLAKVEWADLYGRLAVLRSAQKRSREAIGLIDETIAVFREKASDRLAEAVLKKGYILYESGQRSEAIPYFAEALELADISASGGDLAKRTYESAIHNLAAVVSESCRPEHVMEAIPHINRAKKLQAKRPNNVLKQKLFWAEGRLHAKLGSTNFAQRRFTKARKGLIKLGAVFEAGLVSLDLALIHWSHGASSEQAELAKETYEMFVGLSSGIEALAALRLWRDAAIERTVNEAVIREARGVIEKLVTEGYGRSGGRSKA